MALGLVSCGGVDFQASDDPSILNDDEGQFFAYKNKVDIFTQNDLLENKIGLSFRAFDSSGNPISNLTKSDFLISENGSPVNDFEFSTEASAPTKVDIVFVLDITNSMRPSINSVKENVIDFVEQLKSVNILANLCLVTFANRVLDECTEFQNDDPLTSNNENIEDFLNKLERLNTVVGGEIPENQLQGLRSAAEVTPWRAGARRLSILITDAGFYDATNPGEAGANAQSYPEVYNSIINNRVNSYIVGPDIAGYSQPFQGTAPLASAENFFDFNDLIESSSVNNPGNSSKSLKDILKEIARSLSTVYSIGYDVNKNSLNPDLPVRQRNIVVTVPANPSYVVEMEPVTATFPNGHPVTRSEWALSVNNAVFENLKVSINNNEITEGYQVQSGKIKFSTPPPANAQIKIEYNNGNVSDGISLSQLKLPVPNIDNYKVLIYYNGLLADGLDYELQVEPRKRFIYLTIKASALDEGDKYNIRQKQGLYVNFQIIEQNLDVQ